MGNFGIGVSATTDAAGLAGAVRWLIKDQLPFATAVALTRTAQDVKEAEAGNFPAKFKTHGDRLARGLRLTRAEKRDWPNSKAEVGSVDAFLVLQETGGTKRAEKGASSVAIPSAYTEAKRKPSGRFAPNVKPRGIPKSRKVANVAIFAPDKGAIGPFQPGGADRVRWFLRASVTIKPALGFRDVGQQTATDRYGKHFERELTAATKSARVRAGRFTSEQGRFFYRKALSSLGG